jgi:broad-specificity NMP kinase
MHASRRAARCVTAAGSISRFHRSEGARQVARRCDAPADVLGYRRRVAVVLVTGMSGTGKSSVLAELARRGNRVVDTDYGRWIDDGTPSDGSSERLWREDRIAALLDEHGSGSGHLFISGCVANQGKFYPRFDAVVLLSAPADVILERVAARDTNAYGKNEAERNRILSDLATIEPLLRRGATAEVDAKAPLGEVADALERLASSAVGARPVESA